MVNSANTVEMDAKQNRSYKVCKSLVAWIGVNWGRGQMPADGAAIGEEREDNDYKSPFLEEWMQKKKWKFFVHGASTV